MRKSFAAFAFAAFALAQPAAAVTFPSLTTIYVGAGVIDHTSAATTFHCANVSGGAVTLRFLLLSRAGEVVVSQSVNSLSNGQTYGLSTRDTAIHFENSNLGAPGIQEGVVNIESNNSAVFCTAKAVDPNAGSPTGYTLPLVRVNPHPGTVE